jgi:phage shock protein E
MLDLLKGIFGEKVDLQDLINNGATIVDVRTKDEYKSGHIKSSVNIPLDKLGNSLGKLDKNKPVITCCASGMRSASARSILKDNGFNEVHNGGAWTSLKKYKL